MRRLFLLTLILLASAGCGTNVPALLEQDSDLAWEAEDLMVEAERQRLTELENYQEAHAIKEDLCEPLYSRAHDRIDNGMSGNDLLVTERFWSDLMIVGALIFPVDSVEQCADAFGRYQSVHSTLLHQVRNSDDLSVTQSAEEESTERFADSQSLTTHHEAISPRKSSATLR